MLDPKSIQDSSGLEDKAVLESDNEGTLVLSAPRKFGFDLHWLRKAGLGRLEGGLSLRLLPDVYARMQLTLSGRLRRIVSLDEQRWLRLQVFKTGGREFETAAGISVAAEPDLPAPGTLEELASALLGAHETAEEPGIIDSMLRLTDEIYRKAIPALEKKWSADVAWRYRSAAVETVLIDCSFAFTAEGLSLYRKALEGDYSTLLGSENPHVRLHGGALSHALRQETSLELHLPFFSRKEWGRRLELLARMKVESGEDGRLFIYDVEAQDRIKHCNSYQTTLALAGGLSLEGVRSSSRFTLSYADRQTLQGNRLTNLLPVARAYGFGEDAVGWMEEEARRSAREVFDVSLNLSIPGRLVSAWLDTPGERDASFSPVFCRVSATVQRAMRTWLPYVYFDGLESYKTPGAAFPLLVYQASRPFIGKRKNEFTYDALYDEHLAQACRSAQRSLPEELERVHSLLVDSGMSRTAAFYRPSLAPSILAGVLRGPRHLKSLLVADAFFVDALINLGCHGRELRETVAHDPQAACRSLVKFAGEFAGAFHGRLRRLYGGRGFPSLGSMLLVEATSALSGGTSTESPIQAVLRVHHGGSGRIFVNQKP